MLPFQEDLTASPSFILQLDGLTISFLIFSFLSSSQKLAVGWPLEMRPLAPLRNVSRRGDVVEGPHSTPQESQRVKDEDGEQRSSENKAPGSIWSMGGGDSGSELLAG